MDGLRNHEPWAASALYDAFGEMVDRFVWRVMGDDPEHDDLVQLAFIKILGSVGSVREPSRLKQWVIRVTVNTVRKELRRRRFRRLFVSWDSEIEPADASTGPDEQLLVKRFYRVLDGMRASDRIVFTLRFLEQRTLSDVARLCGCSLATVKRRLARAKQRFSRMAMRDFVLASVMGDGESDV